MAKSKFRPLHDRVVVKRIDAEEKTKGGIIIPDTAKEKPSQGEITAVGPGGRDEADQRIRPLGDHDRRIRHQFVAPACSPPIDARGEIDRRIGLLPGALPQVDGCVFVFGAIGAQAEWGCHAHTVMPGLDPGIQPLRKSLS